MQGERDYAAIQLQCCFSLFNVETTVEKVNSSQITIFSRRCLESGKKTGRSGPHTQSATRAEPPPAVALPLAEMEERAIFWRQ